MKWVAAAVVGILASAASEAWVVERFLSPNRPVDVVISSYLKAVKDNKASSQDLAELAVLVAQKGFPGDAETFFRLAIKKDKLNIEADYRLAVCFSARVAKVPRCGATVVFFGSARATRTRASCWRLRRNVRAGVTVRSTTTPRHITMRLSLPIR